MKIKVYFFVCEVVQANMRSLMWLSLTVLQGAAQMESQDSRAQLSLSLQIGWWGAVIAFWKTG